MSPLSSIGGPVLCYFRNSSLFVTVVRYAKTAVDKLMHDFGGPDETSDIQEEEKLFCHNDWVWW
jgi:hypothetical protein